jgi:predicted regulator of Ras-like GTPase activity (Roadblock/LC7/MglB family)
MTTIASQDEITQILTSLKTHGVTNAALTTLEGRSLGSTVTESQPRFKLGALSAASIAIATKTAGELSLGELDQVQIISSTGSLLLSAVGHKALLSVVTDRGADFPQIARDMKKAAAQLNTML